jgi:hypothetical protein
MRWVTPWIVTLVLVSASLAHALDCERVRSLHAENRRASDIARELGITTPDVQACLADDEEGTAPPREQASKLPLAPQLPAGDAPIPRPPNQ